MLWCQSKVCATQVELSGQEHTLCSLVSLCHLGLCLMEWNARHLRIVSCRLTRCAAVSGPSDGSMSSATGRQEEAQGVQAGSPHLDIFEPRPVLSGGLEAVLGQEAESLGSMSGALGNKKQDVPSMFLSFSVRGTHMIQIDSALHHNIGTCLVPLMCVEPSFLPSPPVQMSIPAKHAAFAVCAWAWYRAGAANPHGRWVAHWQKLVEGW